MQNTAHAQEPRACVYKRATPTVVDRHRLLGKSSARVNHSKVVQPQDLSHVFYYCTKRKVIFNSVPIN